MKSRESGLSVIELLIFLAIVGLVGFLSWHIWHNRDVLYKSSTSHASSPLQHKGASTLTGTVTAGPTTPVCMEGQSCSSLVTNHTLVVINSGGETVVMTKTNSSGVYTVALSPGQYILKLVPYIGISDRNYQVTVSSGINQFNIEADTGIR